MAEPEGYSPRNRAERIIAAGRLFIAVFLLVAVLLDPTEPRPYAALVLRLAEFYVAYAVAVAALVSYRRATGALLPRLTHGIDLVLFSVFMHFTDSADSPFFLYFVFATLCGAIRWHGQGALLTGGAVLAIYLAVAASDILFAGAEGFELGRFIARCTQLATVTGFVAYMASYQHRLQREIAGLAAWPRPMTTDQDEALRMVSSYAAKVMRVPRVVLAWEERDEPSLRVAKSERGALEVTLEAPGRFGAVVAPALQSASFLTPDASAPNADVLRRVQPDDIKAWRGMPLEREFQSHFRLTSVIAAPLRTESIKGWLFALDRSRISADDLVLGEIVARLVADTLELRVLLDQLREAAATEERLRMARELHDGVLQSLTAASLQTQRTRSIIVDDPAEASRRLATLEQVILEEQRSLRRAITDLKPLVPEQESPVDCGAKVRQAAERIERQWDVRVRLSGTATPPVTQRFAHEIVRMAQEALVNAIRHGDAREISLALSATDIDLILTVEYTGRGFAGFAGRYDLASLTALKIGPRSLKERVSALGGSLRIESAPDRVRVEIGVPAYAGTLKLVGS